jgi:hypothetical protein
MENFLSICRAWFFKTINVLTVSARFEDLTAVLLKIQVWDMLCQLENGAVQEESSWTALTEDEGIMIL